MQYGLTEVFVKHDYYSSLRIKIVRRDGEKLWLCEYLGDKINDIEEIVTNRKIYEIQKGFFIIDLDSSYGYIYEDGEYSIPRYKYIKHIGSSRSSKSWSLEECAIRRCEETNNLRLTIWRDTKQSLSATIWEDFKKLIPLSGRSYKFTQDMRTLYFSTGSTISPQGDDTTNAHGLTQDIAWLNEPYKMSKETFDQIDMRADQIWIDINPKQGHWSDDLDKHPRCKVIHSTFQDNPFCPIEMRLKILSYDPSNPINVENGTADAYNWQVYGLGMKAEKPNRVFRGWKKITRAEYDALEVKTYIGCDWGKNHPWGILEVKYYDGALYLRQLNYASEVEIQNKLSPEEIAEMRSLDKDEAGNTTGEALGIVSWLFSKLGINKKTEIICDTNRPLKIAMLRKCGWDYAYKAVSKSIQDGIDIINSLDIYYTDDSPDLEAEYENYSYPKDRYGVTMEEPEDDNNHLHDPLRYVALYLVRLGIINRI